MHHSDKTKQKIADSRRGKFGDKSNHWKGGKIIVGGYLYVYSPNHPHQTKSHYVCEHRLIMEKKLGRFLERMEVVHHINGNRFDNRIENLVLCISPGKHSTEHHVGRNKTNGQFISK